MPSTEIPTGAEPIEPGKPRRSRLLIGCAVAAGAIFLICLVLVVMFVSWLRTPGEPLEARRVIDPSTILYAELHLRDDDEAARQFLLRMVGVQMEQGGVQDKELPEPMRWLVGSRRPGAGDMGRILPVTLMVTRQEAAPGVPSRALLAASFPRLGNRLKLAGWMMGFVLGWKGKDSGTSVESYRDENLLQIDADGQGFWVSIVGSNFLLSRIDAPVKWAIDRIKEPAAESAAEPLLAARPDKALLYIAARKGYGNTAVNLIEKASPTFAAVLRPMFQDAGPVTIWAGLDSTDALTGEIHVAAAAPGEKEAEGWEGSVTSQLPGGQITMSLEQMTPKPGELHAWKVKVTGLESLIPRGGKDVTGSREGAANQAPPEGGGDD
ncbi:MAG TPA: hypothetical protein VNI57_12965 [Candidatus Saccharimonadales bacterium]|nr:hypothetical protein [Candidatus Saccharimonadales bacterium]